MGGSIRMENDETCEDNGRILNDVSHVIKWSVYLTNHTSNYTQCA